MNDLRFVFAAIAVFAAAFVGVSFGMPLVSKSSSVAAVSSTPASLDAPSSPVEPPAPVEARIRRVAPPLSPAPAPARGDAGRDRLAQTALQAANAYARAPCDRMAKTAFIVAASTYLRVKDTPAPDDARVHAAIKAAFETGHIGSDEFPPDLMIAGRFAAAPSSRAACVNSAGLRP